MVLRLKLDIVIRNLKIGYPLDLIVEVESLLLPKKRGLVGRIELAVHVFAHGQALHLLH